MASIALWKSSLPDDSRTAKRSAATADPPLLNLVLLLCLLFYAATTFPYLSKPLLDEHSFRQCQTAISVRWLAADLNPLRMFVYETPLLGAPWRLPFEFPLYQWLAAGVSRLTPWKLETCCRIVAALFHLACLWPLWRILRLCGGSPRLWKITACLFLMAPVLQHWSRTALIETTAVYLALEYLAAMVAWIRWRSPWSLGAAAFFAVLAVLVKVTTFPPFAAAAGVACLLSECPLHWHDRRLIAPVKRLTAAALPLALALGCLTVWLDASDAAKKLNPIAAVLASSSDLMKEWNYGTLSQKTSLDLWYSTLVKRAVPEAIGWPGLCVLVGGMIAVGTGTRIGVAVLLVLYVLPFMLFTNLHIVHTYYQAANAVWLVAALALILDQLCCRVPKRLGIFLVLLCLGGQAYASKSFLQMERWPHANDWRLVVAQRLQQVVSPDAVVVYVNFEWSPEIAFYSERRAIYVPHWVSYEDVSAMIADPTAMAGGLEIGAVVIKNNNGGYPPYTDQRVVEAMTAWGQSIAGGSDPVQIGATVIMYEKSNAPGVEENASHSAINSQEAANQN